MKFHDSMIFTEEGKQVSEQGAQCLRERSGVWMPQPHVHCTTLHMSTHTLSLSFLRDNERTHSHLTQAMRIHEVLPVKSNVVLAHSKGLASVTCWRWFIVVIFQWVCGFGHLSPLGLGFLLCKGETATPLSQGYVENGSLEIKENQRQLDCFWHFRNKTPLVEKELDREWKRAYIWEGWCFLPAFQIWSSRSPWNVGPHLSPAQETMKSWVTSPSQVFLCLTC